MLKLAAAAVEARLNADHSDHVGAWLACPCCGKPARYAGRRDKPLTTALGPITLSRAYYHCATCGTGFCPRDRAMGIEQREISPAVTRMIGIVGAEMSFEKGAEMLRELAAIELCTKQVERSAEALGAEIAADEQARVEHDSDTPPDVTMYCSIDGTGVPMRASELVNRAGKQPDGSAKTREVKLCAFFTAESRDKDGKPVRDEGSVTYSAAIESAASTDTAEVPSEFAQRVLREAHRRGFDGAPRRVVLGDGALWIWALAEMQFPDAIQIVDIFHAKQHLSDLAKVLFAADGKRCKEWAERRHRELDEGRQDDLFRALDEHVEASKEAKNCRAYFYRNRHRMRYPEFRAMGLCVATGVVEAACKTVVGDRLKCSGMHWTVRGANAIAALRCSRLSNRFADFWDRRAAS